MARPLPKDLEKRIAGVAKRSEVRSVAGMAFILGAAFGFGLGASFFSVVGGTVFFLIGAAAVAALWYFAAKRRKSTKEQ